MFCFASLSVFKLPEEAAGRREGGRLGSVSVIHLSHLHFARVGEMEGWIMMYFCVIFHSFCFRSLVEEETGRRREGGDGEDSFISYNMFVALPVC